MHFRAFRLLINSIIRFLLVASYRKRRVTLSFILTKSDFEYAFGRWRHYWHILLQCNSAAKCENFIDCSAFSLSCRFSESDRL